MNEDIARLDHGRLERQGFPEVVMASGKTPDHVAQIMAEFAAKAGRALATRATEAHFAAVAAQLRDAQFDTRSKLIRLGQLEVLDGMERHFVAVTSGGTSDLPIAEECAQTLEWANVRVERFYDIGIAYLERLLSVETRLRSAAVCVVVAGMEGALPSVLGGRVACPMIAVPTSVGYGASFHGLSALLGMLNSCAAGVTVVNIDNGFGAGFAASLINRV
jgi:pyridinium-3,5-biscarboxylic acid mononucleotide synthase